MCHTAALGQRGRTHLEKLLMVFFCDQYQWWIQWDKVMINGIQFCCPAGRYTVLLPGHVIYLGL